MPLASNYPEIPDSSIFFIPTSLIHQIPNNICCSCGAKTHSIPNEPEFLLVSPCVTNAAYSSGRSKHSGTCTINICMKLEAPAGRSYSHVILCSKHRAYVK